MPINEAGGIRRSNLTKEQKREAEAAIYGLAVPKNDMDQNQFSPDDIERMRAILAQHDAQNGPQKVREFDLNKPAKEPYIYREFPKMVYDHKKRTHKIVHNAKEEQVALKAGFENEPFVNESPVEIELDEEDLAEAKRLDKIAKKKTE